MPILHSPHLVQDDSSRSARARLPGRSVPAAVGALLAFALLGPSASRLCAQAFVFSDVANTTTTVPGQGGPFGSFAAPSISGNNVAFYGSDAATLSPGIYTGLAGTTGASRIADLTTPVPGQGGSFQNFGNAPTISGSSVAFLSRFGVGPTQGVYTGTVGVTGASRVADLSTLVPGQSVPFGSFTSPSVSGGTVAFGGTYSGGGQGIYTAVMGTISPVVDQTSVVPGQAGPFSALGSPALSGSNVAFYAGYNGANGSGIYTGTAGIFGSSRVADRTTAVPGQAGNFTDFNNTPSISGNNVAFRGTYSTGFGIYTGTVGATGVTRVADFTTIVPGQSVPFNGFNAPSISGNNVAFRGNYGSTGQGLFLLLNGTLIDVIDDGDALFGSTVTSLTLGPFGFDGTQIAFGYTLANGQSGIAVASFAVPEPSTWALAFGALGLLGLGRRFRRARPHQNSFVG